MLPIAHLTALPQRLHAVCRGMPCRTAWHTVMQVQLPRAQGGGGCGHGLHRCHSHLLCVYAVTSNGRLSMHGLCCTSAQTSCALLAPVVRDIPRLGIRSVDGLLRLESGRLVRTPACSCRKRQSLIGIDRIIHSRGARGRMAS
jgi:hypothetical protein